MVYIVHNVLMIITNMYTAYLTLFHIGKKNWKYWIIFDMVFLIVLHIICYVLTDGADFTGQKRMVLEYARGITTIFWAFSMLRSINYNLNIKKKST